jgi:DNA-directed RNA polymerase beta' subunit
MSIAVRAKRRSDVKKTSNKNININHSPINITIINAEQIVNIVENSPNIDEIIDQYSNRIVKELQQLAQNDLQALEALNKILPLIEELRKADSKEGKLTIFKEILSIASSISELSKLFADLLRH